MRDLYSVLGVDRRADQAEIRKAFKKLARQFHPDLNKEPAAADRFKEVTAAYEVLGDEERRPLYDEFGEVSLKPGFDANRAKQFRRGGGGGMGGFGRGGRPDMDFGWGGPGGGGGVEFDDVLGSLFGGGARRARGPQPAKGPDVETTLRLDLIEVLRGHSVTVTIRRPTSCAPCGGAGGTGKVACARCGSTGRIAYGNGLQIPCDVCGGPGFTFSAECPVCAGTGRTMSEEHLKVRIPAAIEDGAVMRLRGKGGEGRLGGPAGDLLLTIDVDEHAFLRREGQDLFMDVPLTVREAVEGGFIEVPTLDGKVRVKVPAGVGSGRRLRVRGKGVGEGAERGDLFLELRPTVPTRTDPEAVRIAALLDTYYDGDVREALVLGRLDSPGPST